MVYEQGMVRNDSRNCTQLGVKEDWTAIVLSMSTFNADNSLFILIIIKMYVFDP